jgi:GNAT superfamily N-acetyltransferase
MANVTLLCTGEPVTSRPFEERDWWPVRQLLTDTYRLAPPDWNWDVRRWDGSRYHRSPPRWGDHWESRVQVWETHEGRLVGAAHPEDGGDAFLELHPDYRHIEAEMVDWAEEQLTAPTKDGSQPAVTMHVYEYDLVRRRLLVQRGWQKTQNWGVIRRLRFGNKVLPAPQVPEGYILRTPRQGDEAEYQRFADLLNAAFGRTFHNAAEIRCFRTQSPSYRADLDMLAEAPDGSLAATVGFTYVEANRNAIVEPVCTHPDHLRKGLARALMFEGFRRVKALGAVDVTVATAMRPAANRFYESVGFPEVHTGHVWRWVG